MKSSQKVFLLLVSILIAGNNSPLAHALDIDLIGVGSISGTATDNSGLLGNLEDGTPHNRLGGFGSALAYTGFGNRYVAAPDRGPSDGMTSYLDRYYTFDITVGGGLVVPTLLETHLLTNGSGQNYTGNRDAFDATNSPESLRFDPEGIRVSSQKTLFISDEYGPFIHEFNKQGERIRTIPIPDKFGIANPSANPTAELSGNTSGRQANRGMEGLAISPDGKKLYGAMQSALIQDGALNSSLARRGVNNRILEIDLATGATREFVFQLDDRSNGVNEIVAINDHEFLVIERDGRVGSNAQTKKIFWIDINGATDVSGIAALPQTGLPAGVTAVSKSLLIDMLDPAFNLAGAGFPEKIEALAFGPDLLDGRHLLLVLNDNDFMASVASNFYAFAIGTSVFPDFQAQVMIPEPSSFLMIGLAIGCAALARRKIAA